MASSILKLLHHTLKLHCVQTWGLALCLNSIDTQSPKIFVDFKKTLWVGARAGLEKHKSFILQETNKLYMEQQILLFVCLLVCLDITVFKMSFHQIPACSRIANSRIRVNYVDFLWLSFSYLKWGL